MKLNRVLIAYKRLDEIKRHVTKKRLRYFERMTRLHEDALKMVKARLDSLGMSYEILDARFSKKATKGDLIISIGGDGTFLSSCHIAGNIPILGINTMPYHSVGFFCFADMDNYEDVLLNIRDDKITPKVLPTIETRIDSKVLPYNAVNDVLFARATPAEVTRYELKIGNRSEMQKSSGIWISTGAGSTGGILSAGGTKLSVTSKRLQYRVREPFAHRTSKYRMLHGILKTNESIEISPTRDAAIYIDGPDTVFSVKEGQILKLRISDKTISVFM